MSTIVSLTGSLTIDLFEILSPYTSSKTLVSSLFLISSRPPQFLPKLLIHPGTVRVVHPPFVLFRLLSLRNRSGLQLFTGSDLKESRESYN